MDHNLLVPNSSLFPLSYVTLSFLASWLEYLIFSPCTTGSKAKKFIYLGMKIGIGIVCEWTQGPKYWLQGEVRYFGV